VEKSLKNCKLGWIESLLACYNCSWKYAVEVDSCTKCRFVYWNDIATNCQKYQTAKQTAYMKYLFKFKKDALKLFEMEKKRLHKKYSFNSDDI
jgi:hypothetical protein